MSKIAQYLKENFPNLPLDTDIDEVPDLKVFRKMKNWLEQPEIIENIIKLFQEDLMNNSITLTMLLCLKSLIAILGFQFVITISNIPLFLKKLQINITTQENQAILSLYLDILLMISEKTKPLIESKLNFEEIKVISQLKKPLNQQKLTRYAKNSTFDEIYLQGMILHKKTQIFLDEKEDKYNKVLDYLKELDQYQSKTIQSWTTNISNQENNLLRKITQTNKTLIEKLKSSQQPFHQIPKKIPLALRTSLKKNESLPLESLEIEYKNYYFPLSYDQTNRLECCICAFLNTNGGRVFLGVKDEDNRVVGIKSNMKQREDLKHEINKILEGLNPKIPENQYKLIFLPVQSDDLRDMYKGLCVLKLIIKKGGQFLYSTSEGKYFKRRDGKVKMLFPEDLKIELKKKAENPNSIDRNLDDFNDPEPEPFQVFNDNNYTNAYNSSQEKNEFNNNDYYPPNYYSPPNNYSPQQQFKNNSKTYHNFTKVYLKKPNQPIMQKNPEKVENKKIKDVNRKVLFIKIMDQISDKKIMSQLILCVKDILINVYKTKILQVIQRTEKRYGFFEFENENIYERKEDVFEVIEDGLQTIEKDQYIKRWNVILNFAEIAKYEKYQKKFLKIKID